MTQVALPIRTTSYGSTLNQDQLMAISPALQGSAALLVWGDINSEDVDDSSLNAWWTNEHLPERMSIPGFLRARRYFSRDDAENVTYYMTLYETKDLATLTSPAYMNKLNHPTPGTQHHLPTLATMKRAACQVLHSQKRPEFVSNTTVLGGAVWMLECTLVDGRATTQLLSLVSERVHDWMSDPGVLSLSLIKEDPDATAPGSSSQSYLNANLQLSTKAGTTRCILLIELSRPGTALSISGLLSDVLAAVRSLKPKVLAVDTQEYAFLAGVGGGNNA